MPKRLAMASTTTNITEAPSYIAELELSECFVETEMTNYSPPSRHSRTKRVRFDGESPFASPKLSNSFAKVKISVEYESKEQRERKKKALDKDKCDGLANHWTNSWSGDNPIRRFAPSLNVIGE